MLWYHRSTAGREAHKGSVEGAAELIEPPGVIAARLVGAVVDFRAALAAAHYGTALVAAGGGDLAR